MSTTIYVGNLHKSVKRKDLKKLFEAYGAVTEAVVITEPQAGAFPRFGFLSFEDDQAADLAARALNGAPIRGLPLEIRPYHERDEGSFFIHYQNDDRRQSRWGLRHGERVVGESGAFRLLDLNRWSRVPSV